MPKKPAGSTITFSKDDLWIAPTSSLKRPRRDSAWEVLRGEPSQSNKFLELADVALGYKTPTRGKNKRSA